MRSPCFARQTNEKNPDRQIEKSYSVQNPAPFVCPHCVLWSEHLCGDIYLKNIPAKGLKTVAMWCVTIFAAALANIGVRPAPDPRFIEWPFSVTNCTDFTACVWRGDGNETSCCSSTLKMLRLCRECTSELCLPRRETCFIQNATGETDAMCKHCFAVAAAIRETTMNIPGVSPTLPTGEKDRDQVCFFDPGGGLNTNKI